MMLQGLYAITDGSTGNVLLDKVEQALRGGAAWVQYREKGTDAARRLQEARDLQALCHAYNCGFIVNDDPVLARQAGADGVHIGQHDAAFQDARTLLGNRVLIGVSCYNRLELAVSAARQGADYVAFGSFFPSPTKPLAVPATLELLRTARQQMDLPICAIGGITLENAPALLENGADLLAVISDLFSHPAIGQHAGRYQALFVQHRSTN